MEQVKKDAASASFHSKSNHGGSSHDEVIRKIDDLAKAQSRTDGRIVALAQRQDRFEVAVKVSMDDRAQIREHIGLGPLNIVSAEVTPTPRAEQEAQ